MQYKFSLIFSSIYVTIVLYDIIPNDIVIYLLLAIVAALGIAGIGYLLNDWKDYDDDLKNNKSNLFLKLNKFQALALIISAISTAILPWLYLPFTQISLVLLILELLLFVLYALPPFRWKERGILGIICDSLYAQLIPCIFAVYTFAYLGKVSYSISALNVIYILWLFVVGVRNIIIHQIYDYHNDIATDNRTFVVTKGLQPIIKFYLQFGFIAEIILFLYLLIHIPCTHHVLIIIYFAYLSIIMFINRKTVKEDIFGFIHKRFLNEFYEIFLPLILVLIFTYYNINFYKIMIFNILLFMPIYKNYILSFAKKYIS